MPIEQARERIALWLLDAVEDDDERSREEILAEETKNAGRLLAWLADAGLVVVDHRALSAADRMRLQLGDRDPLPEEER